MKIETLLLPQIPGTVKTGASGAAPSVKALRFPSTEAALILRLAPSCPACTESSLA